MDLGQLQLLRTEQPERRDEEARGPRVQVLTYVGLGAVTLLPPFVPSVKGDDADDGDNPSQDCGRDFGGPMKMSALTASSWCVPIPQAQPEPAPGNPPALPHPQPPPRAPAPLGPHPGLGSE